MDDRQDQKGRLRLIRSPNMGPVNCRLLIARFGQARTALDALPDLVMRSGSKMAAITSVEAVEHEMALMHACGAQ